MRPPRASDAPRGCWKHLSPETCGGKCHKSGEACAWNMDEERYKMLCRHSSFWSGGQPVACNPKTHSARLAAPVGTFIREALPPMCPISIMGGVPDRLNKGILQKATTHMWQPNNIDHPDERFQNGVELWVHRRLSELSSERPSAATASLIFAPIYFSYMYGFSCTHMPGPIRCVTPQETRNNTCFEAGGPYCSTAHDKMQGVRLLRQARRGPTYVVGHAHPNSCMPDTVDTLRLVVDTQGKCLDTKRHVIVPYVVSEPAWLVARTLPSVRRTNLLFFRGHMPRQKEDRCNVRATIIRTFTGERLCLTAWHARAHAPPTHTHTHAQSVTHAQPHITQVRKGCLSIQRRDIRSSSQKMRPCSRRRATRAMTTTCPTCCARRSVWCGPPPAPRFPCP